jgi:predicted phage tail protein
VTTVKLYGILSKEFGHTIKIHLGKVNDVLNAIDAIKSGFRKKVAELNNNKYNYCLEIDKKNKTIHILPAIGGSGKAWKWIVTAVLVVLAVAAFYFGMWSLGASLLMNAFSMGMMAAMKPQKEQQPAKMAMGGAYSQLSTETQSYIFSNQQNVSTQGAIVDLGYGRFKANSKVIAISVKSFPTNIKFLEEGESSLINYINIYD